MDEQTTADLDAAWNTLPLETKQYALSFLDPQEFEEARRAAEEAQGLADPSSVDLA